MSSEDAGKVRRLGFRSLCPANFYSSSRCKEARDTKKCAITTNTKDCTEVFLVLPVTVWAVPVRDGSGPLQQGHALPIMQNSSLVQFA